MEDANGWFGFGFCVVGPMMAAHAVWVAWYLSRRASEPDGTGSSPNLATLPVICFPVTNCLEAQWQPLYYTHDFLGREFRLGWMILMPTCGIQPQLSGSEGSRMVSRTHLEHCRISGKAGLSWALLSFPVISGPPHWSFQQGVRFLIWQPAL